jgi:hypothetical protein
VMFWLDHGRLRARFVAFRMAPGLPKPTSQRRVAKTPISKWRLAMIIFPG